VIDKGVAVPRRCSIELVEVRFINFEEDIYDATVIAAFGGLRMDVGGGDSYLIIHPIFPFLVCLALVTIQLVLISGVALEIDQDKYMKANDEIIDRLQNSFDMERGTKFALMAILQSMIFSELFQAVRMFWFCLTPRTWKLRPNLCDRAHMLGRQGFDCIGSLVFLSLLASGSKALVAYLVSTTSLSIILACPTVTEAIFNSLALTFVMELDNKIWLILSSQCDLKLCDPADADATFRFRHQNAVKRQRSWVTEANVRRCLGSATTLLFLMEQVAGTLFALTKGWLPTTRIICGMWRFAHGDQVNGTNLADDAWGNGWGAKKLLGAVSDCREQDYDPSLWAKYEVVLKTHPKVWWSMVITMFVFVVVPPLTQLIVTRYTKAKARANSAASLEEEDSEEEEEEESSDDSLARSE